MKIIKDYTFRGTELVAWLGERHSLDEPQAEVTCQRLETQNFIVRATKRLGFGPNTVFTFYHSPTEKTILGRSLALKFSSATPSCLGT